MAKFLSDQEIVDYVLDDIRWARDFRRGYKEDWKRFYKLYKNYIDKNAYPFEANLAIPTAYTVVEVQVAFLVDMILAGGDFVEVLGKTPSGQLFADSVRHMLNYHFRHSIRTYEDMQKFARQLLILGSSIYKAYWDYRPGWKTRIIPRYGENDELVNYESVPSAEILANKPNGYTVDLFSFGVDPNSPDILNARFAFEEMWIDPMSLVEKEQLGIYKNTEEVIGGASSNVNYGLRQRLDEISITPFQEPTFASTRNKVLVVDYWGYLTKGWKNGKLSKQAKQQLYHVVLALADGSDSMEGRAVLLLAEPSPFHHNLLPFIDARLNACVGEFYGTGDIEFIESLLVEQRDMRNMYLDNINRSMNQMYKIRRDAEIDEAELTERPGGIVHVGDHEDVQPLERPIIDPGTFKTQEDIRREIEQVTGVNDFIMGQYRSSTGFNDTATGISLIQSVAMKRIAAKGQIIQRAIRDIGQMVFKLTAQYQPWGTSVRILDREMATKYRFVDISPAALMNEYDFHIVNAPSLGSKPLRQNQLIQLLQILMTTEQAGGPTVDYRAYVKRLLEEMDIPNPNDFLGHEQYNQPLPERLGSPSPMDELIEPEQENALMIEEKQAIYPKMEENHQRHMIVHGEAYDQTEDPDARRLLEEHYNTHAKLAKETRNILATAGATELTARTLGEQQKRLNLLTGGTARSPTAAGGEEETVRAMGNLAAGSV